MIKERTYIYPSIENYLTEGLVFYILMTSFIESRKSSIFIAFSSWKDVAAPVDKADCMRLRIRGEQMLESYWKWVVVLAS